MHPLATGVLLLTFNILISTYCEMFLKLYKPKYLIHSVQIIKAQQLTCLSDSKKSKLDCPN